MRYRVVLERTDEGIAVSVPGLPECHSQGANEAEALEMIAGAIRDYLAVIEEQYAGAEARYVEVEDEIAHEPSTLTRRSPSPAELRKLPPHEQDAIIAAQVAEAEHEYRTNPDLTAFEAFGEEDGPYDDYPPAESR